MKITSLRLHHFKNYESEYFEFSPKYNAIVGNNGMGKTNLLDAVYFSCMTKSNFIKLDKSLVMKEAAFLRTVAAIEKLGKMDRIVCKFDIKKKKIFEVNDKPYEKLSDHVGKFPVVFIVPGDQILITEGSKERRKLLDNTLSQLDAKYLDHLFKYNALLNQRNAYLKSSMKSGSFSKALAVTYTERMADSANYIFEKRKFFIERFSDRFASKYRLISNEQEIASCEYKSPMLNASFIEASLQNIDKDRFSGRTSFGIHRDDIIFYMNDEQVKYFASQGQTKSFILSIKLTQFEIIAEETGVKPILLLDDLFDKLDHNRVKNLIALLEMEEVDQVFISDTDEERIVNILQKMNVPYKKLVIQEGRQKPTNHASEEE